jgi:flagellar hook assembly protein FlgD
VRFYLYQNYPNPFNSSTLIKFDLPTPGHVRLTVYNILGQKVIDLENNILPAGTHQIHWDARNANGIKISSGVYFYTIQAENFESAKKLLLLK